VYPVVVAVIIPPGNVGETPDLKKPETPQKAAMFESVVVADGSIGFIEHSLKPKDAAAAP